METNLLIELQKKARVEYGVYLQAPTFQGVSTHPDPLLFIDSLIEKAVLATLSDIEKSLPEEGIKWMQEGSKKDRKGYTLGFNECRAIVLTTLDKKKELLGSV